MFDGSTVLAIQQASNNNVWMPRILFLDPEVTRREANQVSVLEKKEHVNDKGRTTKSKSSKRIGKERLMNE